MTENGMEAVPIEEANVQPVQQSTDQSVNQVNGHTNGVSTNPSNDQSNGHVTTIPDVVKPQSSIELTNQSIPENGTFTVKQLADTNQSTNPSTDPYYLAPIPSLNDYLEYIKMLQNDWRDSPKIDVVFQNLNYFIKIPPDEVKIPNIGNAFADFFRTLTCQMPPKVDLPVFENCSGTIPSGKMTLVLAPPGAGKSQFLKALAGRLRHDKRVTGDLWYNGLTADEQLAAGFFVEKLCALVAQGDVHFANLTVRETLQFSLESCVSDPALLDNPNPKLLAWHKRKVDLLLSVLGMHECAETIAGNAVIRGISGGQKKRLTIGEFMITNARLLLLDEPTTGLDAAVARDIMVVLREWCQIAGATVIAALLQPTPECYALYDNLILMREGNIVYQGPRDDVYQFLWDYHGIEADPEQDIADFLVDWLTDPKAVYAKQRRRWMKRGGPREIPGVNGVPVTTARETAVSMAAAQTTKDSKAAWSEEHKEEDNQSTEAVKHEMVRRHSRSGRGNQVIDENGPEPQPGIKLAPTAAVRTTNELMVAGYRSSPWFANQQIEIEKVQRSREGGNSLQIVKQQAASSSVYTREQFSRLYARPFASHTASSLRRQFVLLSRDSQTIPARMFSAVLVAVILGSLFYRLGSTQIETYSKFGMILFALLNSAMGNFTELPAAFEGRNAVYKHLDAGMYPSLSYMFSVVCAWIPVMFLETVMFSIPLYFMVGLAEDAGRYFFFFLVLLVTDLMLAALYRTVCYCVATIDQGQQVLNPVFNFMILFGGFLITRTNIPVFLIEFYWLTPISWALRSLVQNEFYDDIYEGNGELYLNQFEVQSDKAWKWAGVGYELGFFFVCIVAASLCLVTFRFDLLQGTKRIKTTEEAQMPSTRSQKVITIPPPGGAGAGLAGQGSSRTINTSFSLPFTPASLVFKNLHYTVKVKNNDKQTVDRKLLNGISGYVKPGQCTALMGASGAGKTTLMDVIAGRKTAGVIEGDILVNGAPQDPEVYKRISGYCEQQDLHLPLATVRESLLFSAFLRLPTTVDQQTREKFVDEILDLLELTNVKDRIIGNEAYVGLSPGQLKLVTIGVELVANPSILFLDEPTSGLDSRAALLVMRVVKNIAATGRTVLCTIHQPSSEVFYLFDYLLLLKSGGETVYFGPLGEEGSQIIEYFENDGCLDAEVSSQTRRPDAPTIPDHMNPASWMLDVIGAGVAGALSRAQTKAGQEDDGPKAIEYSSLYPSTALGKQEAEELEKCALPDPAASVQVNLKEYEKSSFSLFWAVLRRGFISSWRDAKTNYGRISTLTFLGVIFGLVFLQIDDSTYAGVISKLSSCFSVLGFGGMLQNQLALPSIIAERAVFYRERASNSYPSWMYATSLGIVEIPYIATSIMGFILPFYFMVGFNNGAVDFFQFWCSVFMLSLVLSSFGQWAGATFPSFVTAVQGSGTLVTFWFLFGGIFIYPAQIPEGWKWFYYLNPIPKALIACALKQFRCDAPNPYTNTAECPTIEIAVDNVPTTVTTHAYINSVLDAGYDTYGQQIAYLVAFYVFWRLMIAVSLKWINHLKR